MGFFEGLDAEAYDRKYRDRDLIKRILVYFKPQSRRILVVACLTILISLASATSVLVVSRGVDLIRNNPSTANIILIAGIGLVIGVFIWVANWVARRTMVQAIASVIMRLASDAFKASTDHDLSFYDEFSSGKIVSRITSDTKEFSQIVVLITDLISQIVRVRDPGGCAGGSTGGWHCSSLPPFHWSSYFHAFRRLARKVTRQGIRAMANVNSTIKETVSGIAIAKNFRQEASIFKEFDDANHPSYRVNLKRGLALAMVFPTLNAIGGVGSALLVYTGG